MSLRAEIEAVRDLAVSRLDDAHDYYSFTAGAWRTLQQLVEQQGLTFTLENRATGTRVAEADLAARAQRYVAEELAVATLQQFVSIFETFLADAIRLWLVAHPQSLARRQLTGEDILALPDKAAIVDALVAKELAAVLYDRPTGWFRYLNDRVATGSPTELESQQFAEIKATRDVLVHGQSIAPGPYHRASWELLRKLALDIGSGMAAKA
jgi:hypothetical protein